MTTTLSFHGRGPEGLKSFLVLKNITKTFNHIEKCMKGHSPMETSNNLRITQLKIINA